LTSLLSRSIAWLQYTFFAGRAAEEDDVADFDVLAIHHDAINEQLDECTALVEVSESLADRSK
jgi:hypothetical protein